MEKKLSYKVGDKVVILTKDSTFLTYGKVATIVSINATDFSVKEIDSPCKDMCWYIDVNKVVLEDVYNSPLYKALQED